MIIIFSAVVAGIITFFLKRPRIEFTFKNQKYRYIFKSGDATIVAYSNKRYSSKKLITYAVRKLGMRGMIEIRADERAMECE